MAVITRYIVERNGEEKMTFVSKKDADAYDKELEIAENLQVMLENSDLDMDEALMENVSLYLARNRDAAGAILKGSKPKKAAVSKDGAAKDEATKKPSKAELKAVEAAASSDDASAVA